MEVAAADGCQQSQQGEIEGDCTEGRGETGIVVRYRGITWFVMAAITSFVLNGFSTISTNPADLS